MIFLSLVCRVQVSHIDEYTGCNTLPIKRKSLCRPQPCMSAHAASEPPMCQHSTALCCVSPQWMMPVAFVVSLCPRHKCSMLKMRCLFRNNLRFLLHWTDRVLGLESPLISSKPQSHSMNTPGKSEAEHLFVTATQFAKEQHANGTFKEGDGGYPVTISDPHLPVSEERWALDALRNCKFFHNLWSY